VGWNATELCYLLVLHLSGLSQSHLRTLQMFALTHSHNKSTQMWRNTHHLHTDRHTNLSRKKLL